MRPGPSLSRASDPHSFNWHRDYSFFLSVFSLSFFLSLSLFQSLLRMSQRDTVRPPPSHPFHVLIEPKVTTPTLTSCKGSGDLSPFLYSCNWTAAVHVCEYYFFSLLCILQKAPIAASFSVFWPFYFDHICRYTPTVVQKEHSLTWMTSCSAYSKSLTCIWTWVWKKNCILASWYTLATRVQLWSFLFENFCWNDTRRCA